ncbi:hypothetical protein ABZ192_24465 [Streptomyces sp. NPDC006235]
MSKGRHRLRVAGAGPGAVGRPGPYEWVRFPSLTGLGEDLTGALASTP